ncbi:MAG: molecular chaperone HtpG [Myxococcota bacterium]|jgi:molecular chaperone HtpG|nr:molecular chaperone HtpG [Myxococcota bacterium]
MATETHEFQAEVKKLLDLMIHSLYSNKDVFLRELISNASDALDRLRFEGLTQAELLPDEELAIRLFADPEARTLTLEDNGIGMSRTDLVENLGTIARSGTLEFLRNTDTSGEGSPDLIGQFGVGFYSSFMVADQVSVLSRRAGEETATRWSTDGSGEYALEEAKRDSAGTTITLHLKPADGEDGISDYAEEWTLRQIVTRYSDFVSYPIRLTTMKKEEGDDLAKAVEIEEPLNSMKAIWTRPASEVSDEEYKEFYSHITHDHEEPLLHLATALEGTFEARALLYLPSRAPMDLYHREMAHRGIQLYVRRVFIMDECRDLMPEYLRFVKGVVDAEDLSLNVSREMLQQDRQIQAIRKHLVKKVLGSLKALKEEDEAKYLGFWAQFGPVLKEGLLPFDEKKERILDLVYAATTGDSAQLTSLSDYVDRMGEDQDAIYYMTGSSREVLAGSPHLEAFAEKGLEVLLFTDPVDEVWLEQMPPDYREKKFQSVGRGEIDLGSKDEKEGEESDQETEAYKDLIQCMGNALQEEVKEVRLSNRLKQSPSCLVVDEGDLSPQLEAMLRQAGQEVPDRKPILEVNPDHAILKSLQAIFEADGTDARLSEYAELLFGQAVLAGGGQLTDPGTFTRKLSGLMEKAL